MKPLLELSLPVFIMLPRKTMKDKRFSLNQNIFRNKTFIEMNNAKKIYKDIVSEAVRETGIDDLRIRDTKVRVTYTLFPQSRRRTDLSNVLSAVQKFTDDSLVELGILEDDDYKIISEVVYKFGKVDKEHPRAELVVEKI